jgi:polyvinyl alcohol dehydrogenase (cytochrome)
LPCGYGRRERGERCGVCRVISGMMVAMDAKTGAVLWTLQSGGSVLDGPAIADGVVYWGSGYAHIKPGKPNNMVFAFAPTR